jgi:hypothetical protein
MQWVEIKTTNNYITIGSNGSYEHSTYAMEIPGLGCIVATVFRNSPGPNATESTVFVPGVIIRDGYLVAPQAPNTGPR